MALNELSLARQAPWVKPQEPVGFENLQWDANSGQFIDINALQGSLNPNASTDDFGNSLAQPGAKPPEMNNFTKFGTIASGVTGLAGAINAYQQTGLMKDQLNMQKSLANRNIANSAITTNQQLGNQADLAAQLSTGAEYGSAAFNADRAARYNPVDGTPIG